MNQYFLLVISHIILVFLFVTYCIVIRKRIKILQQKNNHLTLENIALTQQRNGLKKVIEHTPVGIFAKDTRKNFRFSVWNKTMEKYYGLKEKDVIGQDDFSLFSEEQAQEIRRNDQIMMWEGKVIDTSEELVSTPIGGFVAHTICVPVYDAVGQPEMLMGIVADITERKQMQDALRQSEEKFRRIFETMQDAYFFTDLEGNLLLVNPSSVKLFGYENKKKLLCQNMETHLFFSPQDWFRLKILLYQREAVEGFELQLRRKDGTTFYADCNVHSVTNYKQKVIALEGTFRDISEHKQHEISLNHAKEQALIAKKQAENANQAKTEFLANMSHEIRTPMNAIIGFSDLLHQTIQDHQQKQYLTAIESSSKALLTLINDILDLSRVEAGKLTLNYTPLNPQTIGTEMQSIFSHKIAEKKLKFYVELDDNLPLSLFFDETRLRQILLNLLGNAVKFTETGYIRLSMRSQVVSSSTITLIIEVEDSGIGIDSKQQHSIFDAFVQQRGQNIQQYGGTGLGLAICHRLIEILGGSIVLESEVGQGSCFRVIFPEVIIATEKHVTSDKEDLSWVTSLQFEPAKILIVDDMRLNRELLKNYLERDEFTLYVAKNGQEAIELVEKHQPDVILMDIKMPVMDGYQATKWLKQQEISQHIDVIAITAVAMKTEERKVRSLCDGFLTKPLKYGDLYHALLNFLPHKKLAISIENESLIAIEPPKVNKSTESTVFLAEIRLKYFEQWQAFNESTAINDIETFAQQMTQLASNANCQPLLDWGKTLQSQAQLFDMKGVQTTLQRFPTIINQDGFTHANPLNVQEEKQPASP